MPRPPSTWRDLLPGLLALAGVIAAALGVLLFARIGQLHGATYELWAPTAVARGLTKHSEVWLEGQQVGMVKDVHFRAASTDTGERVLVHLEILKKYRDQIRRDSYAQIRPGGSLLGTPVMFVASGSSAAPPLADGDTIKVMPQGDTEGVTSQVALASREFPSIIANIKLLNRQLVTARGTVGAVLYADEGMREFEAFAGRFSTLTDQVTKGRGSVGLAVDRGGGEAAARARSAMAQADSLLALVKNPGPRTSFGRFRRDSTLLRTVADVRTELTTVRALLAEPRGTAGRVLADSAIFQQVTKAKREMDALFADIQKRPLRYIAF